MTIISSEPMARSAPHVRRRRTRPLGRSTALLCLASFAAAWSSALSPIAAAFVVQSSPPTHRSSRSSLAPSFSRLASVSVWAEEAEEGFVDHDENLEEGEECIIALKAFASRTSAERNEGDGNEEEKQFLCAGALVRMARDDHSEIDAGDDDKGLVRFGDVCDAWIADAVTDDDNTNVQFEGALRVLDGLFQAYLEACRDSSPDGNVKLEQIPPNFVIQCGSAECDFHCASFRAAEARGFRPLRDVMRQPKDEELAVARSLYLTDGVEGESYNYNLEEQSANDGMYGDDGLIFDPSLGIERYRQIGERYSESEVGKRALRIIELLSSEDTVYA